MAARLEVLFRNEALIAVDKPPGLNVIPGRVGGQNAKARLEAELGQRLWVVHRLDRDTTGVLLFALNAETHRELSMAFEHGEVHKRYLALVEGRLETERLFDWPIAAGRKGRMRVSPEGKPSQTRVRPVELFAKATLVEAEPLTGRTHQIRVHLARAGHPLLFDHQYGRPTPGRPGTQEPSPLIGRTPLHASRVEWKDLVIESPLPDDIRAAITALR